MENKDFEEALERVKLNKNIWNKYTRSEETMKQICDGIFEVWKKNPYQRLGQLLINLARQSDLLFDDLWNVKDEDWIRIIENL